jgi:peroxiredoxin
MMSYTGGILVVIIAVAVIGFVIGRRFNGRLAGGTGIKAPLFTAQAATGGEVSTFVLADALARGPVVLFFYPKSFTAGCTIEAHAFSVAMPDFAALGATVLGISGDSIETQQRFSAEHCASAFPIASDPGTKIAASYGAKLVGPISNRTTYVIARDGTIAFSYTNMGADDHVKYAMEAVRKLVA